MLARKFFLVSLGALALAIAFSLASRSVKAAVAYRQGVGGARTAAVAGPTGNIIGGEDRTWWSRSGTAWHVGMDGAWTQIPELDLPVSADELAFLSTSVIVTVSGEVWHASFGGWAKAEPFPG